MMELLRIEAPLTPETARALRAGQRVLLSGVVYTARDAAHRRLCELLDIKIFVDTDADERILRRIVRDVRDRGRSLESVVDQYLTTVKPMHEMYVEPSKRNADIIVPEGGHNLVAMDMLTERIRAHVSGVNANG